MSTIPSIFNQRQINKSILGGTVKNANASINVTCLVIMRSNFQFRSRALENVKKAGFAEIISVEKKSASNSTESLSRQFPEIKFIVALDDVNTGDMINMGMEEASSRNVLVLYDDLCMDELTFTVQTAKKLAAMDVYCAVPHLYSSSMQSIPVNFIPGVNHSVFNVSSSLSQLDNTPTLYPFDYVGFYDRQKFIRLGGADYTIRSSYWQNLDVSFRAWLWGEKIAIASNFNLSYASEVPVEDQTADLSYLRFYLKNLLPVFTSDHAKIPASSFFAFKLRSSCGISETLKQFKFARKWTDENKYRFKLDAAELIEEWGKTK